MLAVSCLPTHDTLPSRLKRELPGLIWMTDSRTLHQMFQAHRDLEEHILNKKLFFFILVLSASRCCAESP